MEELPTRRVVFAAAFSLLLFSLLTTFALVAWFARAPEPWTWQAMVSMGAAMLSFTGCALVIRLPSRSTMLAGVGTMALSLVRIGPPGEWNWVSYMLIIVTLVLMIPLVHAATTLR